MLSKPVFLICYEYSGEIQIFSRKETQYALWSPAQQQPALHPKRSHPRNYMRPAVYTGISPTVVLQKVSVSQRILLSPLIFMVTAVFPSWPLLPVQQVSSSQNMVCPLSEFPPDNVFFLLSLPANHDQPLILKSHLSSQYLNRWTCMRPDIPAARAPWQTGLER